MTSRCVGLLCTLTLGCASATTRYPLAEAAAGGVCAAPDSSTAPAWFWDSTQAFGAYSEFGAAQSGIITIATHDFHPAAPDAIRALIGTYRLHLVHLTPSGPSPPEYYLISLRSPTREERARILGDGPEDWGPGILIGGITPSDSLDPEHEYPRRVEAMVWRSGLEIALGAGLFGEDGPPRLRAATADPTELRGWWTPGASIHPPPHGFFCLLRVLPA